MKNIHGVFYFNILTRGENKKNIWPNFTSYFQNVWKKQSKTLMLSPPFKVIVISPGGLR